MEGGVHSSLISTCQRESVFAKLNLKNEYPSCYENIFWDCFRSDKASKNWAINTTDLDKIFANKTVQFQPSELNGVILNICSNYVLDKTVLYDDKED